MVSTLKNLILGAVTVAMLSSLTGELSAQRIRLEAKLIPTGVERLASGNARFEMKRNRIRFSTEVEDLMVTEMIEVSVDGRIVGVAPVDKFGFADLNLDSELNDNVPKAQEGSLVEVRDPNGKLLLFGVLQGKGGAG